MAIPEYSKVPQRAPLPTPAPSMSRLEPPPKTMAAFSASELDSEKSGDTYTTPPYTTPQPTPSPSYGWGAAARYGWGS